MDEDEEHLDEEHIIEQEMHGGHPLDHEALDPNVMMVDEEDEEELIEGDVDDPEDGDGLDPDDDDDLDLDDSDDDGALFSSEEDD